MPLKRNPHVHTKTPKQQKPTSIYNVPSLRGTAQAGMMSLAFSASLSHASEAKALPSRALRVPPVPGVTRLPPLPGQPGSAGEVRSRGRSGRLDAEPLLLPRVTLLGFLEVLAGQSWGRSAECWVCVRRKRACSNVGRLFLSVANLPAAGQDFISFRDVL